MPPETSEPGPGAAAGGMGVGDPAARVMAGGDGPHGVSRLPRWVLPAVILFWGGYLVTVLVQHLWDRLFSLVLLLLVSMFLALAIEPGVNRLVQRGWRRGSATALILVAVIGVILAFLAAMGTLVGSQVAELLQNSERYISDTVDFLNDTFNTNIDPAQAIDQFNDPEGAVQRFIRSQQGEVLRLSLRAATVTLQVLSVMLFTFYLVADGPRMRRAICSRLRPAQQVQVLHAWELAITKTGGYLYSRALLALLSAIAHWVVFQSSEIPAPIALALWVGFVSQFLPVVGTYLAGILPVLIAFLDEPVKALVVLVFIVLYQQVENYLFSPRITARTMQLHPAVAFGSALGGAMVLGAIGAILALPAAAMVQALASSWGVRHEVIDSPLVRLTAGPTPSDPPDPPDPPDTPGSDGPAPD